MFSIPAEGVSSTLAYTGEIFGNLKPILFPIFGILIGFFVLEILIDTIREALEIRREVKAYEEKVEREEIGKILAPYHEHRRAEIRKKIVKEA